MATLELAPPRVVAERRGDTVYLRAAAPLGRPPESLAALLREAATEAPERVFLCEAAGPDAHAALREVTYAEALRAAEGIAAALHRRGLQERPVAVLSGNSVDHALVTLGAYLAGVPVAPISAAYSLRSTDFEKLRAVFQKLRPGLVVTDRRAPFDPALEAVGWTGPVLTTAGDGDSLALRALVEEPPLARAPRVGPDTVAKVLFTSGSTGHPKGVPNTHGMLCANQKALAQCWPFVAARPPVLVDWLPWSHTFGGNHNFHLVLTHRGTLLVDDGKPLPGLLDRTIRNLRRMPPTLYFNVPAGYGALVPRLEADPAFRDRFFSRLDVLFYAGAALPDDLWQRLGALAEAAGREVFLTTAWGSTETSPLATSAHFPLPRAGNIGVPVPGVELKLVPAGDKREVRVRGPNVMAGYLDDPAATAAAFDEEGFFRIGDALRLADDARPEAGLLFDGRVAEDFKLSTGTWVSVGRLRTALLAALSPALADLVVAGADRDDVRILAWPNVAGCAQLAEGVSDPAGAARHPAVRAHLAAALGRWNASHSGRSRRVAAILLLDAPPSIDRGEITDKGYLNQRLALRWRAAEVERLYDDDEPALLRP